jgi:hypothetical protein
MSLSIIYNKLKNNRGILFLIILLFVIIFSSFFVDKTTFEGFNLANFGKYPKSEIGPILSSYPFTGRKTVSNNSYSNIWWNYPIFKVGSFAQITNNLRYRKNPDDGVCITADFCGALYKDGKMKSNYSNPLPVAPLVTANSVRVGYYKTDHNLFLGNQLGPELQTF